MGKIVQEFFRSAVVTTFLSGILWLLNTSPHEHNRYLQYFESLYDWIAPAWSSNKLQMVSHENKKPLQKHGCRYNGLNCSEVDAIIPRTGYGMIGRQNMLLWKSELLGANKYELFNLLPITPCAYDNLFHLILVPYYKDWWHLRKRWQTASASCCKKRKCSLYCTASFSYSTDMFISV